MWSEATSIFMNYICVEREVCGMASYVKSVMHNGLWLRNVYTHAVHDKTGFTTKEGILDWYWFDSTRHFGRMMWLT